MDVSKFPNVEKWIKRINTRKGVQSGVNIPSEAGNTNEKYQEKLKGDDKEFKEKEQNLMKLRDEAKKQYDYKYSSP